MSKELSIYSFKKFDPLWPETREVYEKIEPYLTIHKYSKGTVLRQPGEMESMARFVYSGAAVLFLPSNNGREYRLRIFGQGDVASDLDSFYSRYPSRYGIKVLSYVSTFELSVENESRLLKLVPEAGPLASKIIQNVLVSTLLWQETTALPVREGLKKLKESHQKSLKYLSYKDLAFIFKTSVSSISRILKEME